VRHELRTPLAVIQPLLGMLLDGTSGPMDEKQLGYLRMLERNVDRLAAMIASVVETGWLEIAAIPSRPAALEARGLVESTVADVRASLESTPLVEVAVAAGLRPVFGDEYRLRRALRNVLVNACTYTPAGGWVTVSAEPGDGAASRIVVAIADSGPGITADDLPGLGLGLPAARALVEGLGGSLDLASTPGKGTRVTLELPAAG
jgi:signal transduction histidine kinase